MIDASVLKFLSKLHKNNNKAWFDDHRSDYDNCRNLFIQSTGKMIQLIAAFDAPIGTLQPKDCIFRINRDVRFSKDKQP